MLNPSSQNSWFLSQFLNCHWYSARIFYGRFSCTHMNALNSEEEDIYRSGHGVWVWTLWLAWGDIVWETLMSLYLMCLSRRKSCLCVLLQNLCYGPYLSRVLKLSRQEPDLLLRLILSVLYFSSSPSFFFSPYGLFSKKVNFWTTGITCHLPSFWKDHILEYIVSSICSLFQGCRSSTLVS